MREKERDLARWNPREERKWKRHLKSGNWSIIEGRNGVRDGRCKGRQRDREEERSRKRRAVPID